MFKHPVDLVALFIPLLIGFSTGNICDMPDSDHIKIRPPGWVFGVVWSIMYTIMGILLISVMGRVGAAGRAPILVLSLFAAHAIHVFMWPTLFSCMKKPKAALYVLFGSIITALMVWSYMLLSAAKIGGDGIDMYLPIIMVPYISWLCFAFVLNALYVEKSIK